MRRLKSLTVSGFKSIKEDTIELGALNVLIGGNGVGKSNLISAFKFLREIYDGNLQSYVAVNGANALLHFGRKHTESIKIKLAFEEIGTPFSNFYSIDLRPTNTDSLVFHHESTGFQNSDKFPSPKFDVINSGHTESVLSSSISRVSRYVSEDMASYRVYHFHDTSSAANVKQTRDLDDNRFLQVDAGNLAPFLYWMKQKHPEHLEAIEHSVRQIAPFFDRFELAPLKNNEEKIRLEWREKGSEQAFNAHQLSDGTLRFMCLSALLLQPQLPRMVLLDEPELGLHPAAIILLSELLEEASQRTQILVASQSVTLVNQLQQDSVYVADRIEGATKIKPLQAEDLTQWLERYALGELWEKNLIGGRP
jgi:predicted ATPase